MGRRKGTKGSSAPRKRVEGKKRSTRSGGVAPRSRTNREPRGGSASVASAAPSPRSPHQRKSASAKARRPARAAAPPRAHRADIHPLDRAIAELRSELARSPDDATLYARLGALHYRRGDLRDAEACYRRAVELQSDRAAFHNNLGNVLCDLGRMKDGIAAYEQARALERAADPEKGPSAETEANLEIARLEYRLVHERIEYLERAVHLDVGSAEALNALGGGYLLRNQREEALSAFRKAAALDPRSVHAARNIGFAYAMDPAGPDDLTEAMRELAEHVVRFPKEPRLYLHQGELLETAGLLEETEQRYLRALKVDPRCLEAYDMLGRLREAIMALDSVDETSRDVEAVLERLAGEARESKGPWAPYDKAFAEVARARFYRRAPADARLLDRLLREAIGNVELGTEEAREVAVAAGVLRAQLLEGEGRRDEAALVLEGLGEKLPEAGRLWFERGGLAFRSGEVALAVEAFERATLAEPQEALAYRSLRFAFEGYRRYRTERVRFEAAMRKNPRDALAHHHLALTALSVLKDEEALFHFTRALELDGRLAEAACGRARALQRQGHLRDAEAAFREALAIDPDCGEARRALEEFDAPAFAAPPNGA